MTTVTMEALNERLNIYRNEQKNMLLRLDDVEEKLNEQEKISIHEKYEMQQLIAKVVSSTIEKTVKPLVDKVDSHEKSIKGLEDKPMQITFKLFMWLVGGLGSVVIALVIALIRTKANI